MKTIFFGSGDYTIPVMQMLQGHGLDLVVTTEENPKSPLLTFCSKGNIPTLIASTVSELIKHESLFFNHEVAVLASYGAFVPESIINTFPNGILNIHPSLLPIYKGPSPVQYAIKNGDDTTGVTIIKLDNQIDHGPILAQKEYDLKRDETLEDLKKTLFKIGSEMIGEILAKYESGQTVEMQDQDHSKEIFTYKITREDGKIDLTQIPTDELGIKNWKLEISRKIRAYHPWPGVWFETEFMGKVRRFKLLPGQNIQMEGKGVMSYKDFVNGYGDEGRRIVENLK